MTVNDRNIGGPPGAEGSDPRLDRVYREMARDEPPPHVDAAILAAARREVGARPRPLASALRKWRVPVSIAALVVLSVSLVTLVQEEGGDELLNVAPGTAPAAKPAADLPSPASARLDSSRTSVPTPAATSAPARPMPRDDRPADVQGDLATMKDHARRRSVSEEASGSGAAVVAEPAAKPAPQPFLASPRVEEPAAVTSPPAPAVEDGLTRTPDGAPQRGARSAAAGAPAAKAESARDLARTAPLPAPGRDKTPAWQGYEKEPPQKWLERIAEFQRLGEAGAARDMLEEFKRRFPDHPLPPDLGAR